MVDEILKEVAMQEDIDDATDEHALPLACRVEVQRVQKSALHEIKEAKDFDVVQWHTNIHIHKSPKTDKKKDSCKY